ncbi:MAG: primosomal protein N' (replication factor Y) - superfamily II helicase, partial [Pseudomonadota bacterium]
WDLSDLRPYQPEYLAGFRAEAYTIELDEGFEEAKGIMNRQIERDVRFDIGGDAQRISTLKTQVRKVTFKHVLLPVWMAAYKYRGKTYRFVVNGRTGLVQGERPYSAWKITIAVLLLCIVAGVAGYFYAINQ